MKEYKKIDDNTYETFNDKTKIKVILSFNPSADNEKIDEFFITRLSEIYLDKLK